MTETIRPRLHVRKKQIRAVVEGLFERLREQDEFELPIPVEKIAKMLKARVLYVSTEDEDLSGFIYRDQSNGQVVIGVNDSHARTRQRFTLAHEIGHLMLHSFDDLHYDRKGYGSNFGRIRLRDGQSATGENRDEIEANFFAAELLMPEASIQKQLESYKELDIFEKDIEATIKSLSSRKVFDVSPQALTIRLLQLGVIDTD